MQQLCLQQLLFSYSVLPLSMVRHTSWFISASVLLWDLYRYAPHWLTVVFMWILVTLLKKLGYKCFPSVIFWLGLAGHECQSSWDSIEADVFRDEPASLSTNMGVLICCGLMHSNTDELSEQGMLNTVVMYSNLESYELKICLMLKWTKKYLPCGYCLLFYIIFNLPKLYIAGPWHIQHCSCFAHILHDVYILDHFG